MANVFLSYAREDRDCAESLAHALESNGLTVWWDRQVQVGQSFVQVIGEELDQANAVVVIWSRHALDSEWVRSEAYEALQRKVLIPVRIEDVRPPFEFRRLQTADVFDWKLGFGGDQFRACLLSIKRIIGEPTIADNNTKPSVRVEPVAEDGFARNTLDPNPSVPNVSQPRPFVEERAFHQPPARRPSIGGHYLLAVVALILCCPFGAAALGHANKMKAALTVGDIDAANESCRLVKKWSAVAAFGIPLWVFMMFILGN